MKLVFGAVLLLALPHAAVAGGITVTDAFSPLAPPNAMAHAAYMTLTNDGEKTRHLVGVTSDGYQMVHLHQSMEQGGVATMAPLHQVTIKPGQTVSLRPGMMHVMLMRPKNPVAEGDRIALVLEFANGEHLPVIAIVKTHNDNS